MSLLIVSVGVLTVAVAALVFSNLKLWIELKAMQKSTHTVAYVSPEQFQEVTEEAKKSLSNEPFDNIM